MNKYMRVFFILFVLIIQARTFPACLSNDFFFSKDKDVRSIHYVNKKFFVEKKCGEITPINPCYIDKALRSISDNDLIKRIESGYYLELNKLENYEEYSLKFNSGLKGGGILGGLVVGVTGFTGAIALAIGGLAVGTVDPGAAAQLFIAAGTLASATPTAAAIATIAPGP